MIEGTSQSPSPGYDPAALDEALGTQEGGLASTRLPDGYYPADLGIREYAPSKDAGTPGLQLVATVFDGPWKGTELNVRDTTIWLTPGKNIESKFIYIGKIRFMVEQVTGKKVNSAALLEFGFPFEGLSDPQAVNKAFKLHFAEMSSETKLDFMSKYARVNEWDGKQVIVAVKLEQEEAKNADGTPRLDDAGNQLIYDRNSIANLFGLKHAEHGFAAAQRQFPKQQQERDAMGV